MAETRRAILGGGAAMAAAPAPADPAWTAQGAFFCLYAADARAISAWYAGTLGFTLAASGERPAGPIARFALLRRASAMVEVLEWRERRGPAPGGDHPAYDGLSYGVAKVGFQVADVEGLEASLAARGVAFNHRLVRSPELGLRTFAIRDPEGNTLQFFGP